MNFTPNFETTSDEKTKKRYESVTHYMATDLVTFTPDQEVGEVIDTLKSKQISGAPVLNDKGDLVGVISEQDCLRVIIDSVYHNQPISKHRVEEYMNQDIVTVSIDDDIVHVANMFLRYRFRRFPVVDNGKLKGQVSKRDILSAAQKIKPTTW
jgi:CBS domain-containing protein